jgi:hypothetical protein
LQSVSDISTTTKNTTNNTTTTTIITAKSTESLEVEASMLLSRLDAIQARITKLKRSQGAVELPRLGRCRLNVPLDNVGGQSVTDGTKRQIEVSHCTLLLVSY